MTEPSSPPPSRSPQWQPLAAIDRRVAGVLIEKAKTTPNAYPMSLSAICAACNQKSNRAPVMNLEPDDVEESLDRLRQIGAVGIIEGYGRVAKYRHYLYEWLGVEKVELSVMGELLLRGAQTEGDLRARASRMDRIADLDALRSVLTSLKSKGLVIALTPEGRGHVVTHALYPPRELEQIKAQHGSAAGAGAAAADPVAPPGAAASSAPDSRAPRASDGAVPELLDAMRRELHDLRLQVSQLRSEVDDLRNVVERTEEDLHRFRHELGG